MTPQRREIRYHGDVQGVGFRYTTRSVASRYDVTGFVRNEPDGAVRLVAEGLPEELAAFLDEVRSRMRDNIRDVESRTLPATQEFQGFTIRH